MQIIKVPSIFGVYLPPDGHMPGQWLNLALVRQLEIQSADVIRLTWENGDGYLAYGRQAAALLAAWEEACEISRDRLHIQEEAREALDAIGVT